MSQFSLRLEEVMKEKGITQQKLAEHLGTTQQTVSRWIKGINAPDFDMLLRICAFLDEDPNYLLGYEKNG